MKDSDPNYLAWVIVIMLAVTGGNLLSNIITARYVAYETTQALNEMTKSFQQQSARSIAQTQAIVAQQKRDQETQSLQQRQLRAGDPTGAKPARQCDEWTQTLEKMKSEFALQEKTRFCQQLTAYVNSGTYPRP